MKSRSSRWRRRRERVGCVGRQKKEMAKWRGGETPLTTCPSSPAAATSSSVDKTNIQRQLHRPTSMSISPLFSQPSSRSNAQLPSLMDIVQSIVICFKLIVVLSTIISLCQSQSNLRKSRGIRKITNTNIRLFNDASISKIICVKHSTYIQRRLT